jgi:hypothetical protein
MSALRKRKMIENLVLTRDGEAATSTRNFQILMEKVNVLVVNYVWKAHSLDGSSAYIVHGTSLLEGIDPSPLHTMQWVALLAEDIEVTELESSKALDFYE